MESNKKEKQPAIDREPESQKPLLANNFLLMGISAIMIILGFALMAGSPSGLDAFNEDIFSTRRIVVGPLISFLGFVLMAVAIIVKPKQK